LKVRTLIVACILTGAALVALAGFASAAPVVLPLTSSAVTVTASDAIMFPCNNNGAFHTTIVNPRGGRMELLITTPTTCGAQVATYTSPCTSTPSNVVTTPFVTINMDGTTTSPGYSVVNVQMTNMVGAPLDGTWSVTTQGNGGFCIILSTKTAVFNPSFGHTCFYNWRTASSTYTSPGNLCATNALPGSGVPVESSDNFVFFSDQANPDPDPQAFTTQSSVACGPPPVLTMNGVWIRGSTQTGNTFTRFVSIQGTPAVGDTDLTDNVGAVFSTLTDQGSGSTGSSSATTPYNNAAGNSYQFLARAGSTGPEREGSIITAPPAQCTISVPGLVGLTLDETKFNVEVSQAQCAGDPVEFTLVVGVTQTLNDIDVTIFDGVTDTAVLAVDDSEMFHHPTGIGGQGVYYFQRTFNPGPYEVLASSDFGGLGASDYFVGAPFNVPQGACGNTVVPVLSINNHTDIRTSQTNTLVNRTCRMDLTTGDCQGIRRDLHQNLTRIEATLNETEQHADDTIAKLQNLEANLTAILGTVCKTTVTTGDCQGIKRALYQNLTRLESTLNETEQHADDLLARTANLEGNLTTRIGTPCQRTTATANDCEGIKTQYGPTWDESEQHLDDLLARTANLEANITTNLGTVCRQTTSTATDCQGLRVTLAVIQAEIDARVTNVRDEHRSSWATLNETEQHTDDLLARTANLEGNLTTRIGSPCQRGAVYTVDCEGIGTMLRSQIQAVRDEGRLRWATLNETEEHADVAAAFIVDYWPVFNSTMSGINTKLDNILNNNFTCDNCSVNATVGTMSIIDLPGYTNPEVGGILLFGALLVWALYKRWWFVAGVATMGFLVCVAHLNDMTSWVVAVLVLLPIGYWIEVWATNRAAERQRKEQEDATPSG
jgi:hypothetical protein